jgi:hypothetical protein
VLETTLAMAAYFAGQPNKFDGLRAYVQCRIDSGPVAPDDLRVASEMADKGIWSLETTMSATGVEDVGAEKDRIEKEREEKQGGDAKGLAMAQQALDQMRQAQPPQPVQPVAQPEQTLPIVENDAEVAA